MKDSGYEMTDLGDLHDSQYDSRVDLIKEIVNEYLPGVIRAVNEYVGHEVIGSYRFRSRIRNTSFIPSYGMTKTGVDFFVDMKSGVWSSEHEYKYTIDFGEFPYSVEDEDYTVARKRVEAELDLLGEQWVWLNGDD